MRNLRPVDLNLFEAVASLENPEEARVFLRDLCTPAEIQAMGERLHIASLLIKQDLSYREISELTGASTTTIGRVARFLREEDYGGYQKVLQRLHST